LGKKERGVKKEKESLQKSGRILGMEDTAKSGGNGGLGLTQERSGDGTGGEKEPTLVLL